jgi:hypothetical protein
MNSLPIAAIFSSFGMNGFLVAIAVTPLGIYLALLGFLQLRAHPLLVSGGRDLMTLGFGLSGIAFVGPMQLFFPRFAYAVLGVRVWLALLVFYWMLVILVALSHRPRLIIYGLPEMDLRDLLEKKFAEMEIDGTWVGPTFSAEALGVSATVESAGLGNVSHISAATHRQSLRGWLALETSVAEALRGVSRKRSLVTAVCLVGGIAMVCLALATFLYDTEQTALYAKDLFRF